MVRKIGSNTPNIEAPQLYDISNQMYARMGQDVQQASSASMQAFSGLNQAYDANARRQMSHLAEQEELKAAQARASQINAQNKQQSGGVLAGLGSIVEGVVGGFAVQEELKIKREAALLAQQEKDRAYELDVAKFEYSIGKDKSEKELRMWELQTKAEREASEQQYVAQTEVVDAAVANISAQLEQSFVNMTAQEGVAFTVSEFMNFKEQYRELLDANPRLEVRFNKAVSDMQQNLVRHYGGTFRGEMNLERRVAVETMNQKVTLAFADRFQEIAYGAGTFTEAEASASINDIIQQSFVMAQNDPAFMTAVKQNPGLMGEFYRGLYGNVAEVYGEYAKKNADINATVNKVNHVNNIIGQLGYIDDAATVQFLQSEMAALGLPYQDPRSWATTMSSTMKNQAESMKLGLELATAVSSNDPMFGIDTNENRITHEAITSRSLFQAINQQEGWTLTSLESHFKVERDNAKQRNDSGGTKYWESSLLKLDKYQKDRGAFETVNQQLLSAQMDYAKAVRGDNPNQVVTDPVSGMPIRVPIQDGANVVPYEKRSPEEIEALKERISDVHGQRNQLLLDWRKQGIDMENTQNDAYIKQVMDGAAPYIQQLQTRNAQNGRVVNPSESYNRIPMPGQSPPTDNRQSVAPVNFSGGRVPNQQVVQGQTGTLPFATSNVPLANAVPFKGGVAQAPNIGFVPFKGGTVSVVSKPDSKGLVLDSTDPRVASMMGGKVVYSGSTSTMGNVVVLQTKDGFAEVYTELDTISSTVMNGNFIQPGVPIGHAQGRMEFQVWKTSDPLKSLRMEIPRNESNPVAYLQGISGYRQAPSGLGTIDITRDKPRPVSGTNNNIFAGSGYTIYGNILVDKNGKQRPLTKAEHTSLYPNGMRQAQSYAEQQQASNNASWNQPGATQPLPAGSHFKTGAESRLDYYAPTMTDMGKKLQSAGFQVLGYSPLGRNSRLNTGSKSYHNRDLAMDINYDGKGQAAEDKRLKELYDYYRANAESLGITELIFQDKQWYSKSGDSKRTKRDHYDHLHVAFAKQQIPNRPIPQPPGSQPQGLQPQDSSRVTQQNNNMPPVNYDLRSNNSHFDSIDQKLLKGSTTGLSNIKAFSDVIAYAEGHGTPTRYNTKFGGGSFDTSKPHPGGGARGRYQFLQKTWIWANGGQNPPMTAMNQDTAFVRLLMLTNNYEAVLAGDFDKAMVKAAPTWAAIKGAGYTYNGRLQGKYDPAVLAKQARVAAKSYLNEYNNKNKDSRTLITNAPLHQVNAPRATQSSYQKPNPNANFGYPGLAKDSKARKVIYEAARRSGKPQQMIADVMAQQTDNFRNNANLSIPSVLTQIGATKRGNIQPRLQPVRTPITPANPQQQKTPKRRTPISPPTKTPVGRSYTSGNQRKKKEWHFHKRSNCPTCQALGTVFLPHFIYK